MISGSVKLTSRLPLVAKLMESRLSAVVQQTGEDLAQATRDNMYPGHAYDTGNMQEHTTWQSTGKLSGMVVVDVPYAIYVEFGTVNMQARPFMTPAVAADWPKRLYVHAVRMDVEMYGEIL